MVALDILETIVAKLKTRAMVSNCLARFTCGDCERNKQCGFPQHDDCLVKLIQVARDDGKRVPAPTIVSYRGVWPA